MTYEKIEYTHKEYEEYLNDICGEINICGVVYASGYALKKLDDIAFRCGFNDWENNQPQYKCLECDTEHDDEDEAKECCFEELE